MEEKIEDLNFRVTPWSRCFKIDGSRSGVLRLSQVSSKLFKLQSSISYLGSTGLDKLSIETDKAIRNVDPDKLHYTDLASVPSWFLWFANNYGTYTPAAIIHDYLISNSSKSSKLVSAQEADRYFRFMLHCLGITFVKRWLMWTAVALRTRFYDGLVKRFSVILWFVCAFLGVFVLGYGIAESDINLIIGSLTAPLFASVLWGKQYGAGLISAYIGIPWILPPAIFIGVFYGIYYLVEKFMGLFFD